MTARRLAINVLIYIAIIIVMTAVAIWLNLGPVAPASDAAPFTEAEAALAARLYSTVSRPRGREVDLAIAACAITNGAAFWTLNPRDFGDIPALRLVGGR